MSSENGSNVTINGWKASGIFDTLKMGSSNLPPIDPFHDIAPIMESNDAGQSNLPTLTEELRH